MNDPNIPAGGDIRVFDEPELEFRYQQRLGDPRDGLALFGPFDTDAASHPTSLSHGVIGTPVGLKLFAKWSNAMPLAWVRAPGDRPRLWPPYPGFSTAFECQWPTDPTWVHTLDQQSLSNAARRHDPFERVFNVVNLYLQAFEPLTKLDEHIDVIVCVVPDEVFRNCRIRSRVSDPTGERVTATRRNIRLSGQRELFSEFDIEQYQYSLDFRRQIKARVMQYGIPIQILRESTLQLRESAVGDQRQLSPLSHRMWNISSALYYKGGGRPWKLAGVREGVCYIGLAFRAVHHGVNAGSAVCAAQMFLDDGDGIVFLGEYGPWYSPKHRQFRLSPDAAHNLLSGALKTYEQLRGKPISEVFLHSRSNISHEEMEGYKSACPTGTRLIGIRVRPNRRGAALYRPDKSWPILRGTLWREGRNRAHLFGSGFNPRIGTYDGWETPVPIEIDIQHGEANVADVAQDIFCLTKLNYNACGAGDSQPVTIKYSDAVGEILVSNPTITSARPQLRFYI